MNQHLDSDRDMITKVIDQYIVGAKSGSSKDMKAAFHPDATIFGYVGEDLFAGPVQQLFDWNDANGPATGLEARITAIDIVGTVATVRLELYNWTGHRFTDLFTLLKTCGEWKIMNKVFHLHNVSFVDDTSQFSQTSKAFAGEHIFGTDLIVCAPDPRLPI